MISCDSNIPIYFLVQIPHDTLLVKVGPVFEYFKGRFGFLSLQARILKHMDTICNYAWVSKTFCLKRCQVYCD